MYTDEIEAVPYSGIEAYLIKEGIITSDEQQKVSSICNTDNDKQRLFRNIVLKYNLEQCRKFLKCLEKIENFANYEKLYKKLEKTLLGKYLHACGCQLTYICTYVCMCSMMICMFVCVLLTHGHTRMKHV